MSSSYASCSPVSTGSRQLPTAADPCEMDQQGTLIISSSAPLSRQQWQAMADASGWSSGDQTHTQMGGHSVPHPGLVSLSQTCLQATCNDGSVLLIRCTGPVQPLKPSLAWHTCPMTHSVALKCYSCTAAAVVQVHRLLTVWHCCTFLPCRHRHLQVNAGCFCQHLYNGFQLMALPCTTGRSITSSRAGCSLWNSSGTLTAAAR